MIKKIFLSVLVSNLLVGNYLMAVVPVPVMSDALTTPTIEAGATSAVETGFQKALQNATSFMSAVKDPVGSILNGIEAGANGLVQTMFGAAATYACTEATSLNTLAATACSVPPYTVQGSSPGVIYGGAPCPTEMSAKKAQANCDASKKKISDMTNAIKTVTGQAKQQLQQDATDVKKSLNDSNNAWVETTKYDFGQAVRQDIGKCIALKFNVPDIKKLIGNNLNVKLPCGTNFEVGNPLIEITNRLTDNLNNLKNSALNDLYMNVTSFLPNSLDQMCAPDKQKNFFKYDNFNNALKMFKTSGENKKTYGNPLCPTVDTKTIDEATIKNKIFAKNPFLLAQIAELENLQKRILDQERLNACADQVNALKKEIDLWINLYIIPQVTQFPFENGTHNDYVKFIKDVKTKDPKGETSPILWSAVNILDQTCVTMKIVKGDLGSINTGANGIAGTKIADVYNINIMNIGQSCTNSNIDINLNKPDKTYIDRIAQIASANGSTTSNILYGFTPIQAEAVFAEILGLNIGAGTNMQGTTGTNNSIFVANTKEKQVIYENWKQLYLDKNKKMDDKAIEAKKELMTNLNTGINQCRNSLNTKNSK